MRGGGYKKAMKNVLYKCVYLQCPGLCTAFLYVLNAWFFCVPLKHTTFFAFFFSSFWRIMKSKRTMSSFAFFS